MNGRILVSACVAVAMAAGADHEIAAQVDTSRPIKLIVPFEAGEPPDAIARVVGEQMSIRLRRTVVIENRPGAAATFGTRAAAAAEPDGHTLLLANTASLSLAPSLFKNIEYDPIKSFTPIGGISIEPMMVVVHPALPARTVQELVVHARRNPGALKYGAGVASAPHIAWGLLKTITGTDIVFVPYRGIAPAMTDLASGRLQILIDGIGPLLSHIRNGSVRPLAVTGKTRSPDFPDLPTMIESGYPGYVLSLWTGIVAPAGAPADVIATLNAAISESLRSPPVKDRLASFKLEPNISSPQELGGFIAAEAEKWSDIIRTIKAQ